MALGWWFLRGPRQFHPVAAQLGSSPGWNIKIEAPGVAWGTVFLLGGLLDSFLIYLTWPLAPDSFFIPCLGIVLLGKPLIQSVADPDYFWSIGSKQHAPASDFWSKWRARPDLTAMAASGCDYPGPSARFLIFDH